MTDNDAMTIDDYLITTGTAGDSPIGKKLVRGLEPCKGDMCMDAAYLSREMCDMLNELGLTPYIWPKKNSINNAKGSYTWAAMMRKFEEQPEEFLSHYHARSTVEGIFGALKSRYGNTLRCMNRIAQRREIGLRVICYNINVANRLRVAAKLNA